MKKPIKYQFAVNSSGNLIDINIINKDSNNEKYFCIACKQELIPKLGDKRTHHFAHKSDTFDCSKETYLHELGKKIFYETYLQCLTNNEPFYIFTSLFNSMSMTCKYNEITKLKNCIKNDISKYNLIYSFRNIEYEKKQDNFIPDLTLINNYGDKIFIEIAVTHSCEKEKIESKNKIIEIKIKDESDIKIILGKKLSEDNDLIKYYNFEEFNIIVDPFCESNIIREYLIHYKKGEKIIVKSIKKEICKYFFENKDILTYIKPYKPITSINPLYLGLLAKNYSYQRGPKIDNIKNKYNNSKYRYKNNGFKKKRK